MAGAGKKMGRRKPLSQRWPWKIGGNPKKRKFAGKKYINLPTVYPGITRMRNICPNCEDSYMAYQGLGEFACAGGCGYYEL